MARTTQYVSAMISLLVATSAYADAVTNGLNGINIPSIGLDGSGIDIGQIEKNRPGDPSFDTTSPSLYHSAVNPFQVFFRSPGSPSTFDAHANIAAEVGAGGHPVEVAGILISTDTTLKGVAPGAHLYSIGDNATGPNFDPQTAESLQYLITRPGTDIRVVNMSLLNPPLLSPPNPFDGDELLSQFVDWSSRANGKDILYLIAHPQGVMAPNVIPSDNYNGMTIVYSEPVSGVWSRVGSGNNYTKDANGDRTSPALMAPGAGYSVPTWGTSALSIQFPVLQVTLQRKLREQQRYCSNSPSGK